MQEILNHAYRAATKRLFLLDYDGTLVDFMPTPPEAVPTKELLDVVTRLTADPLNTVVITSGRPHQTLDEWLGHLPVSFAAEHGFMIKTPGQDWHPVMKVTNTWKPEVRSAMDASGKQLTGIIVEEKDNALAWHSRSVADGDAADAEQHALVSLLEPVAERLGLRIIDGDKVVEVQPLGVDKGIAAKRWVDQGGWDFVLAAGDDTTDEDLFEAMPDSAFTIKVRPGDSVAKMRVATPADMLVLLTQLPA